MAKKKPEINTAEQTDQPSAANKKAKAKKSGAGAVFGSIVLFLVTCLCGILTLCSLILYTALPQKSLSAAVAEMDLSQMKLTDEGQSKLLGQCLYDWYLWDAPNLSAEYADAFAAQPEVNEFVCAYLDDLSAYLTAESDTLPELDANDIADLMQTELSASLHEKTGVTFAEADRQSVLWSMGDDFNSWNESLNHAIGSGFGRFSARFLCSLPGVITFGALTVGFFVLWLVFAIKGHWRKGRMLTAYGCAVAIPSLLVLIGSGVLLLLASVVFNAIPALSFTEKGLSTLLMPVILPALAVALCGMIVASIGICTNAVVKANHRKKAAEPPISETEAAPAEKTAQPDFVYATVPAANSSETAAENAPAFCPHCGAPVEGDSAFCGSCGQAI